MNRTIKDATVKRFHYDDHDQLRRHLADFVRRLQLRPPPENPRGPHVLRVHLQTLDLRTDRFILNPLQQMPGLNT
jgi:RNA-directed DNA polymerase